MQGSRKYKPEAAVEFSTCDEASHLTLYLQQQLEDDIARIFDESIHPDLELVCGKLKILTHACILKTRSNKFYRKLETILQVNVDRNTFDEIYSFVSDSYTECDIKRQEREIISYLENNFIGPWSTNEPIEDNELYLTPKCLSPYSRKNTHKSLSSSPSIELTKEYYALVPIEGNILDKELKEQDVLSTAFQTIINSQKESIKSCNKPTSLISPNHISNPVKHSNSCDSINVIHVEGKIKDKNSRVNDTWNTYDVPDLLKKTNCEEFVSRNIKANISPDSLVTDDPSSSSDYLSAANASPGFVSSQSDFQSNVFTTKMENAFTSSDSGLGNTGLHESLNSNRDGTLIDISLTESTLHETNGSSLSQYTDNDLSNFMSRTADKLNDTLSEDLTGDASSNNPFLRQKDLCFKTSKEAKQKHNEEIVILESSSLSSETGSWESVFPPKQAESESRKVSSSTLNESPKTHEENGKTEVSDFINNVGTSLVQKSPFKSTSCFIDAASLADEEEDEIRIECAENESNVLGKPHSLQLEPSEPVPCSTVQHAISPQEKSECIDNDDSLEQTDNKDPDSIQKDLSPTIFEMTPITEDSLCSNAFETAAQEEQNRQDNDIKSPKTSQPTTVLPYTPYNSIMSVRSSTKQYESSESGDSSILSIQRNRKKSECQPIVSGGASIEDHLPSVGSYSCSPAMKRKLENAPIVSGAYIAEVENPNARKSPKPTGMSAWVVDMSTDSKLSIENELVSGAPKKPGDKTCESLKNASKYSSSNENCSKSRSSVDSDSSERSSHKFYIDLSTLPDTSSDKKTDVSSNVEKKNMFSMYIDLGDSPRLKEMPARLSSSLNCKKNTSGDSKITEKDAKSNKRDTFETLEMLCSDPNISISEIISESTQTSISEKTSSNAGKQNVEIKGKGTESVISVITEESVAKVSGDLFVRLSDLDKPSPKADVCLITAKDHSTRMTRSIPDDNWKESSQRATSRSIEIISSFHSENTSSLNRLFPHLKNEFSASMPGSLSSRTRSPLRLAVSASPCDVEEIVSDVSEISSVQSSMCRSVVENSTTEDTSQTSSLISNCQSRLGQDLLRMFLQEIAPDVMVEVSGRKIKAHKCILSSRCQYFAGILSGGWVESSGNVIVLPPFSFNVVHFALCHIYSGVSTIPDSISIVELATIADMLGLEGLKEVIMFTLKAKYCHHFHKPCQVCTAGVLECFPLSSVYGLDDLYRKCLRWITKYFFKVWPTKAFATLPKELLDKCYQQHIVNLSIENLVDTVYGCGMTVSSLKNSRWSESVARMCRRLVNAAAHFAAPRLYDVLTSLATRPPAMPPAPHAARQALDDCLAAAIEWAPPDVACRAYAYLAETCARQTPDYSKPDLISNGHSPETSTESLLTARAASWRQQCESALVRAALRVVGTQAFKELPPDLRKRLRELGCIMYGAHALPASNSPLHERKNRSPLTNAGKNKNTVNLNMDIVRSSFVPYSQKPVKVGSVDIIKSTNDVRDVKKTKCQPPKIRMTKAQEERTRFNLLKSNQSQERNVSKLSQKPRIDNAKPKYLQPRVHKEMEKSDKKQTQAKKLAPKKLAPKMISSSESSRNSSPIQARNMRASRLKGQGEMLKVQAMSQDSLATSSRPCTAEPSTDSLSESQTSNKYATYTKSKHTGKGSSESVKTLRSQNHVSTTNKGKTKIPVSFNQIQRSLVRSMPQTNKKSTSSVSESSSSQRGNITYDRRVPASLMCATKSSSAKIVPKVVKEPTPKTKSTKSKHSNKTQEEAIVNPPDIPIMERSGTFLKDELTFGDKTIEIDN